MDGTEEDKIALEAKMNELIARTYVRHKNSKCAEIMRIMSEVAHQGYERALYDHLVELLGDDTLSGTFMIGQINHYIDLLNENRKEDAYSMSIAIMATLVELTKRIVSKNVA